MATSGVSGSPLPPQVDLTKTQSIIDTGKASSDSSINRLAAQAQDLYAGLGTDHSNKTGAEYVQTVRNLALQEVNPASDDQIKAVNNALNDSLSKAGLSSADINLLLYGASPNAGPTKT